MSEFMPKDAIVVGSRWTSCDGAGHEVTVVGKHDEDIKYVEGLPSGGSGIYTKDWWNFQVRYEPMILKGAVWLATDGSNAEVTIERANRHEVAYALKRRDCLSIGWLTPKQFRAGFIPKP